MFVSNLFFLLQIPCFDGILSKPQIQSEVDRELRAHLLPHWQSAVARRWNRTRRCSASRWTSARCAPWMGRWTLLTRRASAHGFARPPRISLWLAKIQGDQDQQGSLLAGATSENFFPSDRRCNAICIWPARFYLTPQIAKDVSFWYFFLEQNSQKNHIKNPIFTSTCSISSG